MMKSNDTPDDANQSSNTSVESNESEFGSSSTLPYRIQYGPIEVRLYHKPTPTLAADRRSQSLVLTGDEGIQYEKRFERNGEAVKKLKETVESIEDNLSQRIQQLENEHSDLINSLEQVRQEKRILEQQLDNLRHDSLDELLSDDNEDMSAYIEQDSEDRDLFD